MQLDKHDRINDRFYAEMADVVGTFLQFERLSVYEISEALELDLDDTREVLDRMQEDGRVDWLILKYKRGPVYYLIVEEEDDTPKKPHWNEGPFSIQWTNTDSIKCGGCHRIHNSPVGIPEECVCGHRLKESQTSPKLLCQGGLTDLQTS